MPSTEEAVGAGLMDFLSDFRSHPGTPPSPREQAAATPPAVATPPVNAPPVSPPSFPPAFDPRAASPGPAPPVRRRHKAPRPPKAARPPLTFAAMKERALNATENPFATFALCFGLASILLPLLAIAGIGLGAASLSRTSRYPWVGGRVRAIAGIAASVVLGSYSVLLWIQLLGA